jgi:hypothetical protein
MMRRHTCSGGYDTTRLRSTDEPQIEFDSQQLSATTEHLQSGVDLARLGLNFLLQVKILLRMVENTSMGLISV